MSKVKHQNSLGTPAHQGISPLCAIPFGRVPTKPSGRHEFGILSAASRRKMAVAQRKRWAKVRAEK